MNTFEQEPITGETNQKIELTIDSLHSLDTTRRWAGFLAILGFIFIALLILVGFGMVFMFSAFDNGMLGSGMKYGMMIYFIILGTIFFFPILYLFRFSNWTKKALKNKSSLDLSVALLNLKSHYKFYGIFTIVVLALYLLAIIVAVIFSAFI